MGTLVCLVCAGAVVVAVAEPKSKLSADGVIEDDEEDI